MAEIKNQEDPTLHAKRKPDRLDEDAEVNLKKIQKIQTLNNNNNNSPPAAEENSENDEECDKENKKPDDSPIAEAEIDDDEEDDDEEEDSEEEDDDDENENGEKSNGKSEADRKGKGIMRDDKGKGKMIEEEDDDDDSDSDDDGDFSQSEAESDLSDDPLAEVDLDNILPSRTRRRASQPGFYIANDAVNAQDDDSDDSDA